MSTIFISYRRSDSAQFTARLHAALEQTLGPEQAFLDIENIAAASDWKAHLQAELERAAIVVVVIGARWLAEIAERLDQEDQVVWEIHTALQLGKTIVPLLIDGAAMPAAMSLPEPICLLPSFNAIGLASPKEAEFSALVKQIAALAEQASAGHSTQPAQGLRRFLNPALDMLQRYADQEHILQVVNAAGQAYRVPTVAVLNAADGSVEQDIEVVLDDNFFKAKLGSKAAFEEYKADAIHRGKSFYDTDTARLLAVEGGTRLRLHFQPTSYFEYVKTNMAMDFDDAIDGTLRDEVHPDGRLEALSSSKLANHTGINGLVFSNDGEMIFQKRSATVLTNPLQLCPGFSGAMTADDIERSFRHHSAAGTLDEVNVYREMTEELGIRKSQVSRRCFMGLSRELLRGGKPELFYAVDIDLSAREILACCAKDRGREGEIFALPLRYAQARLSEEEAAYYRENFSKVLKQIEVRANGCASLPLLSNLVFWINQHQPPLQRQI
ncbi:MULTISPECIES: toll/interleukin-1 receptor domain-containing protein [unclassified Undibacterium]|uniref:toll/interleukin-1 receptor domain-containing protein n=1 Tax=unclassified Undibacterium TaxID=2630295 RepID=UPI002AC8DAB7|nr:MULTISPECIES: toll/interleukin-1 receptor domain-containing protein [unclassified Undibacterium]MEB0139291.1 toll/interleukin-1 receptor domain-containing protein [Undibacterium sp. CCC2.1]MEB0172135.1 toll/interleukin-1 receptor domain-containing protein [Undibacterium sp. CCC1.1]MEB0176010.1 toll/interleukin-1 receptor domain-containing protein [Undibacterium sp. CCC3.4]MEB0215322.1 toll/interleukin-1 receptor domain-containing protein [Undibacterium sp. 5I2]WPX45495.1 toll/interleukin-1 